MELVKPEIGLIFWMLLTFLIVLFLLRKFAWKPILKFISDREESIENTLKSAEQVKAEMAALKTSSENILKEAAGERDKMLREAKDLKDKIISEAKTQAQEEAKKVMAQAMEAINKEKDSAFRELKEQVAGLAMEAATRILKHELSNKEKQETLVGEYLNEVNAN